MSARIEDTKQGARDNSERVIIMVLALGVMIVLIPSLLILGTWIFAGYGAAKVAFWIVCAILLVVIGAAGGTSIYHASARNTRQIVVSIQESDDHGEIGRIKAMTEHQKLQREALRTHQYNHQIEERQAADWKPTEFGSADQDYYVVDQRR